jgi:dUTP pyrophosphatase
MDRWTLLEETMKYKKLDPRAITPIRHYVGDAGLDLFALEDILIRPGEIKQVKTGIAIALEPNTTGLFWGKSGLATRGLAILGGCIDNGYRAELIIIIINLNGYYIEIPYGKAITQLIIVKTELPLLEEGELDNTDRGTAGFGSTSGPMDPVPGPMDPIPGFGLTDEDLMDGDG